MPFFSVMGHALPKFMCGSPNLQNVTLLGDRVVADVITEVSYWNRVSPSSKYDRCAYRKGKCGHRRAHTDRRVKMERLRRISRSQEIPGRRQSTRSWETDVDQIHFRALEGTSPADTLVSGFWPPEPWENIFCRLSHPLCGPLLRPS